MNSAAIEVELTSEYTMKVFDGGMSAPDGAEAALTAAAHLFHARAHDVRFGGACEPVRAGEYPGRPRG
nr:hypothetical protein [Propionibacterium sp.]